MTYKIFAYHNGWNDTGDVTDNTDFYDVPICNSDNLPPGENGDLILVEHDRQEAHIEV